MNQSNWYVITGAPSAGKTTLIRLLEKMGYDVVHEAPRAYIDQEIEKGREIEQIRRDELLFQKIVLEIKIKIEEELSREKKIFFDRGIPDSRAYYELHGKMNDEFLEKALQNCLYKKVFLLDFFDLHEDYARTESRKEQIKIHDLLEKSYKKTNTPIVKVPIMESKEDRLEFVLANL